MRTNACEDKYSWNYWLIKMSSVFLVFVLIDQFLLNLQLLWTFVFGNVHSTHLSLKNHGYRSIKRVV